jgi:hypothetical protein
MSGILYQKTSRKSIFGALSKVIAVAFWAFVGTVGFIFTAGGIDAAYCLQRYRLVRKSNLVITHFTVMFVSWK